MPNSVTCPPDSQSPRSSCTGGPPSQGSATAPLGNSRLEDTLRHKETACPAASLLQEPAPAAAEKPASSQTSLTAETLSPTSANPLLRSQTSSSGGQLSAPPVSRVPAHEPSVPPPTSTSSASASLPPEET